MTEVPELQAVLSEPVAVMGLGATGRSVLKWLRHRGVTQVKVIEDTWTDAKRQALAELEIGEAVNADDPALEAIRTLVVSPGVFPNHPLRQWCKETGRRLINDIQLWAWAVDPHAQAIGITGSNGKSTVTAWVEHVAKAQGCEAVAVGNIGLPILEVLEAVEAGRRPSVNMWVMELSSFQLDDCEPLKLEAATILNLSEDHLDYHSTMDDYLRAKQRIIQSARHVILPDNLLTDLDAEHVVRFGSQPDSVWRLADGQLWYRGQALLAQSRLPVLGNHNALNALAVMALLEGSGFDPVSPGVLEALCSFKGLPHRVERIAQFGGVDFIEDSKGTNVGSTLAALEGLGAQYSRLILIAGGDGKGQDFSPLLRPMAQFCREVLVIGRDGMELAAGLNEYQVPYQYYGSLESAVEAAFEKAEPGDAVVLSPACASWDMFRNYLHRAEVFTQTVKQCIERASASC